MTNLRRPPQCPSTSTPFGFDRCRLSPICGYPCGHLCSVSYGVWMAKRFIPLSEVCEILDISSAQAYALVRSGDLPAIKVGGRGQWRVETAELESYIQRMYARTAQLVASGDLEDDAQ